MVRITSLDMSMADVMITLCDGNPGALTTLMELASTAREVDPDNMLGELGAVLQFDTYGIYGTDIYVLWNDQCNRDTHRMHLLMRATQLGMFSSQRLKELAGDQMCTNVISEEEFADLNRQVCERLPAFMPAEKQAA